MTVVNKTSVARALVATCQLSCCSVPKWHSWRLYFKIKVPDANFYNKSKKKKSLFWPI